MLGSRMDSEWTLWTLVLFGHGCSGQRSQADEQHVPNSGSICAKQWVDLRARRQLVIPQQPPFRTPRETLPFGYRKLRNAELRRRYGQHKRNPVTSHPHVLGEAGGGQRSR